MKNLAWRSLAISLIAALGACTSAATPPTPTPSSPTSSVVTVVTGYYQAVVSRNYRHAFGYLAPGATGPDGRELTTDSFLQLAHMLDGMGGPVTRFSIGVAHSGVVMTLYRAKYGPYHAHLQMARTPHGWAISSLDRI